MTLTTTRRMVAAEILKLRRNRSLMAFVLLLTSGVIVLVFGYKAIQHATDPSHYGPAGGLDSFSNAAAALGVWFGALAAILIGGEAGTADLNSGVFRDLVATGRSRLALFAVRAPAAIVVTLAFSAVAFALAILATFVFAGSNPTPDLSLIVRTGGWIALANVAVTTLAVGVGSLTGSRAVTLTAVIGWQTVASQLLLNVTALGSARDGLLTASLDRIAPVAAARTPLSMTLSTAAIVVGVWCVAALTVGAWRTATMDA
jgi:ABC-type transport system involved in multi-copper enzyme maturation permease subunit